MIILEESPWYNEILRRGEERGRRGEASELILKQLTRRFDQIEPIVADQVRSLSLETLEALGEALLDFTTVDELNQWLQQHHAS